MNKKKRKSAEKLPSSVKALFWDPETQKALVLLKPNHEGALKPDLPGGSPKPHETIFATLAREVLEETGLELDNSSSQFHKKDGHLLFVRELALTGLELRLSAEHHGAVLIPLHRLPEMFENSSWCGLVCIAIQSIDQGSVSVAA